MVLTRGRIVSVLMVGLLLCWLLIGASSPPDSYYNGTIVVRGSAPLVVPFFITPYGEFVIVGELRDYLVTHYQQKKIRVRGRVRAQLSNEYPRAPALEIFEVVGIFQ